MIARMRGTNNRFKELQVEDRAVTKVNERKLSANEREYNKIMEQKRQEHIANRLRQIHKQEQEEYWKKDVISQPYLYKDKNLFKHKGGKTI